MELDICFLPFLLVPPLAGEGGDGKKVCSDRRYYRICPVAGCRSRPQKKLSQHMVYMHPQMIDRKEELLKVAKRVPHPKPIKKKLGPVISLA